MNNNALEHFKDWTNYLLVTTVAALGWVGTKDAPDFLCPWLRLACVWSLALSCIFGIFTLALIPLIAEQQGATPSFYDVKPEFQILGCNLSCVSKLCASRSTSFLLYASCCLQLE